MALTNIQIINAKPREKSYKLFDSEGLYLQVNPTGSKCWRLKYRFNKKERTLSFGQYPEVSLSEAREARSVAKKNLSAGKDPNAVKKAKLHQNNVDGSNTFEFIATELLIKKEGLFCIYCNGVTNEK